MCSKCLAICLAKHLKARKPSIGGIVVEMNGIEPSTYALRTAKYSCSSLYHYNPIITLHTI